MEILRRDENSTKSFIRVDINRTIRHSVFNGSDIIQISFSLSVWFAHSHNVIWINVFALFLHRFAAKDQNLCLDDLQQDNEKPYNLGLYTCHRPNVTRSQFFTLTDSGVIRNELSCASVQQRYVGCECLKIFEKLFVQSIYLIEISSFSFNIRSYSAKSNVVMASCLDNDAYNEKWEMTPFDQIRNVNLDLCLDYGNLNAQDHVFAQKCNTQSETQKWIIEH